jgi:hypothetical protein
MALPALVSHTYRGVVYWWHRQHELDVAGPMDEGVLVAGGCRYMTRQMAEGDLAAGEDTVAQIDWHYSVVERRTTNSGVSVARGFRTISKRLQQTAMISLCSRSQMLLPRS